MGPMPFSGSRFVLSSQQPAASSQQPAASSQQPAASRLRSRLASSAAGDFFLLRFGSRRPGLRRHDSTHHQHALVLHGDAGAVLRPAYWASGYAGQLQNCAGRAPPASTPGAVRAARADRHGRPGIERGTGPNGCSVYRVGVQNSRGANSAGVQSTTERGATGCTQTVNEPSLKKKENAGATPSVGK